MSWRNVVKKMESYEQMINYPSEDSLNKQHVPAKGDDYQKYRNTANQHWDSMKTYYHKVICFVARLLELPRVESSGKIPPLLVVNLQIPLYPPAIFQHDYDGEGMSFVSYFKLSENYEELPLHFQENIRVRWSFYKDLTRLVKLCSCYENRFLWIRIKRTLRNNRSEMRMSDHRPVCSVFMIEVEVFDPRKLRRSLNLTSEVVHPVIMLDEGQEL